VGDPLADVAYAEVTWVLPGMFTTLPASLTPDELVTRYEGLTGTEVRNRPWHRAFQQYKIAVIMLLGAMLFDSGATNDPRLGHMGHAVAMFTTPALAELGIDEALEQGPVFPRHERFVTLDRSE
jgi:aminoglycoside phosphotransferase (APT) family kinase protein